MLPWEVWATFPMRHIQRFYQHVMREKWRDRFWHLRLVNPKVKEPSWLYDDLDAGKSRASGDDEYEKMKAYFRAREGDANG